MQTAIHIELPAWLRELWAAAPERFPSEAERMAFAVELSRRNVEAGTGGPFGAAVFERESGRLIAPGVNVVVPAHTSVAHAETVAIALAGQHLRRWDLGAAGEPETELAASSQPCVQCFGNVWWSGVTSLLIGARAEDVESIAGFKEGPLPERWVDELEGRGPPLRPVRVRRDLLRDEATAALRLYRERGGEVYNAGSAQPRPASGVTPR